MLPLLPLVLLALPSADAAVAVALALPGARAEVGAIRVSSGAGCSARTIEVLRPVEASGDVALRLGGIGADGAPCTAWAWTTVRVVAPALSVVRDVRTGEPLAGAVREIEIEVRPGHAPVTRLGEASTAAHALRPGAVLAPGDVREGPAPGEPVAVLVRAGGVELETRGRAVPCPRGKACALLDGGRRVEGRLTAGRILVEAP